jgi:hypothetical protein
MLQATITITRLESSQPLQATGFQGPGIDFSQVRQRQTVPMDKRIKKKTAHMFGRLSWPDTHPKK